MSKHTVTLLPSGNTVEVEEGVDLLKALREADVYIKSTCGGYASCTDCIIKISSGADNLTSPPIEEINLLGNVFHITKERLACQTKIIGPVSIDISAHDKDADKEKLRQKTSNMSKARTKIRKPAEQEKVYQERREMVAEKNKEDDTWEKHWEKDKDPSKPKKLGGNARPKPFLYDEESEDEDQ
ncbi:MAG: 2Fe-2S iron-sulfur cluster binding domain-containing protein [Deltaproteobacteria bacterium]|jgi:uncharacterized 2Fe-2S/4Fe-4S cluster protein (DUF4445 family)|nr:MAG: 2Fe-2S iron-sulfur cluster binding domain-containing protein [Deltaproteobacteria bacterium]TNF31444.1 MAG: 2Fe-2S iron-sulfur cluster binding domain-containing protein [Deltaproteobacteria bacterium]